MWSCGHAHMWPCGADHVRSYPREVMTTRGLVGVSRVRTSPPGVKEQFTAVAAAHGLAFGELLERALDAFVREAKTAVAKCRRIGSDARGVSERPTQTCSDCGASAASCLR